MISQFQGKKGIVHCVTVGNLPPEHEYMSDWTWSVGWAVKGCMKCGWRLRVKGSDKVLRWASRQFDKHTCQR